MSRPSKTDQELAALRDCWTEIRTMEAEYHGVVSIYVSALARPGTFGFRMVFTPLVGPTDEDIGGHSLEFIYPNVEQSFFAGFLWRKAIALSRMVREGREKPVRPFGKRA
jgi:hypothetical protein